jgi:hypothetical protein
MGDIADAPCIGAIDSANTAAAATHALRMKPGAEIESAEIEILFMSGVLLPRVQANASASAEAARVRSPLPTSPH